MSAEASPGASPKRCKNAKNERLPSIPIRLRSPQQLETLDQMVRDAKIRDPKVSRNSLVIAKVFGTGDPSGDALPLQDALDKLVLLMFRAKIGKASKYNILLPGKIINASITRLKQKGEL